ncbi:hypothetical protein PG985_003324 [Apiospora marii]|uniref:uncharacterized protein n=1 Tax=Apiospora marii TaxID=335849 RepID=UPI0031310824
MQGVANAVGGGSTPGNDGTDSVGGFLQELIAIASRRDEGAVDQPREDRHEENEPARPPTRDTAVVRNSPQMPRNLPHQAQPLHNASKTQTQPSYQSTQITQETKRNLRELLVRARRAHIASNESAKYSEQEAATEEEVDAMRELVSEENAIGHLAVELSGNISSHPQEANKSNRRCWVCEVGTHSPNMCMQVLPGTGMTLVCPIHPCVPGHGLDDCPHLLQFLSNPKLLKSLYWWLGPERKELPPIYTETLDINALSRWLGKPLDNLPWSVERSAALWREHGDCLKKRLDYDVAPSLPEGFAEQSRSMVTAPQTLHGQEPKHGNIPSLIRHLRAKRDVARLTRSGALQMTIPVQAVSAVPVRIKVEQNDDAATEVLSSQPQTPRQPRIPAASRDVGHGQTGQATGLVPFDIEDIRQLSFEPFADTALVFLSTWRPTWSWIQRD